MTPRPRAVTVTPAPPPERTSKLERNTRGQPRSRRLRRDLRASSADAVSFSLMVGAGETYVPAFALALGAGDVAAGLVSTLPMLAGAALQLVSPRAVLLLGSHRRWVVLCAALQAASFAPLAAGAWRGALPLPALFAAVCLYWACGMATGPTWNTWMESVIPRPLRAHYLARRTRFAQLAVLAGMAGGALVLALGRQRDLLLASFALLFAAAGLFRVSSAGFLARQSEPDPIPRGFRAVPPGEFLRGARRRTEVHLLAYLLCVQTSVHVAAPFFTPYMLGPLALSYPAFMLLTGTSFAAKAALLPALGVLARRFGPRRLLLLGGTGVAPLAALWTVSDRIPYLLGLQVLAGTAWGAFELAVLLLFFDAIPRAERTSTLTFFNLANATAMVAGCGLGAALLSALGESREGYAILFAISTAGRIACLWLLRRVPEPRLVLEPPILPPIAVRPSIGGIARPVLADLRNGSEPSPGGPAR